MQVYELMFKFLLGADFPPTERLRFMFTPNGEREFLPPDQVFPLIVVYFLLLVLKNK